MDTEKIHKIMKELDSIDLSSGNIRKLLGITEETNFVKNKTEFSDAVLRLARELAKTDHPKTVDGMRNRLLNKKKKISVDEAYRIQEEYGIPFFAWRDPSWFYRNLLPAQDEEK